MKNPEVIVEAEDIKHYMRDLWRTGFFRESHDNGGLVHKAVEQFADLPRFFFEISHPDESSHFSAWWGGIQKREYDNPAIHDLYYLHEIWHAGTMVYMRDMEFSNFRQRTIDNELGASFISEMGIYLEMPGIRKETFDHEIFMDRFLFPNGPENEPNQEYLDRWNYGDRDRLVERLKLERRNVMMAATPNMEDDVELWIQKFTHQNQTWAHLWFARQNMVESAMLELIEKCKAVGRKKAMDDFMKWLTSDKITNGTGIPFPDEAHAFAGVADLNRKVYKETFQASKDPRPLTHAFSVPDAVL